MDIGTPATPSHIIFHPAIAETPEYIRTPAQIETHTPGETPARIETPAHVEPPAHLKTPVHIGTPAPYFPTQTGWHHLQGGSHPVVQQPVSILGVIFAVIVFAIAALVLFL